jgi:hypothetical protein
MANSALYFVHPMALLHKTQHKLVWYYKATTTLTTARESTSIMWLTLKVGFNTLTGQQNDPKRLENPT